MTAGQIFLKNAKLLSKTYLGMFAAKVGIRLTKDVLIIMKREWLIQFS